MTIADSARVSNVEGPRPTAGCRDAFHQLHDRAAVHSRARSHGSNWRRATERAANDEGPPPLKVGSRGTPTAHQPCRAAESPGLSSRHARRGPCAERPARHASSSASFTEAPSAARGPPPRSRSRPRRQPRRAPAAARRGASSGARPSVQTGDDAIDAVRFGGISSHDCLCFPMCRESRNSDCLC